MKLVFDFFASFMGILMLSPVFLIIGILIKIDSKGPVFFRGRRIGRAEKEFTIYKFRTMYEAEESYKGLPVTARGDKRVTAFGRWLRNTKLNELPQLWNVIIGDMSLVGPRPESPEIVKTWPEDIRRELLSVRPGLTSQASIIYRDEENILNELSAMDQYLVQILPEKQRLDQLYIHNQSFLGDLDVIFTTILLLVPRLRTVKIEEKRLFSGFISNFVRRYLTWFIADFIVAFLAITISGIIWRINTPLHLGGLQAFLIAIAISLVLSLINYILGLGQIKWRYASPVYTMDLLFSTIVTSGILIITNEFFLKKPLIPLGLIINFGILTFSSLVVVRYRERLLLMLAQRWKAVRGQTTKLGERILIVGAGISGQLTVWLLQKSIYYNWFNIVGFVDDNYQLMAYKTIGYPILGPTMDIPDIVEKKKIGLIFFCISKCSPEDQKRILALCRSTAAKTAIIPDLNEVLERSIRDQNLKVK